MKSISIRNLLGVSRAEFCRRYDIPLRTVQDWDLGQRQPPEWIYSLLERVVTEDVLGISPVYKVVKINPDAKDSKSFVELISTKNIKEIKKFIDNYIDENTSADDIELRAYGQNDQYVTLDIK